jgi:D-3-phosphoglycerate dehydrogenase
MQDATEALILDLLEWIGAEERSYSETMEAWRTSCPRLPVWEEANDRGLVTRNLVDGCPVIRLSPAGRSLLRVMRGNPRGTNPSAQDYPRRQSKARLTFRS